MIHPGGKVVFGGACRRDAYESPQPAARVSCVRLGIEFQIRDHRLADDYVAGWQNTLPGRIRRHEERRRFGELLAQPFILAEEKGSVGYYRAPDAAAELIPLERRNFCQVEEVARVQRRVANELK